MSADTVNNLVDPSNGEPMEIVLMYCLNGDGTRDVTLVSANRNSRIVLPLPNEILEKMGIPAAAPNGARAAEVAAAQAVAALGHPFMSSMMKPQLAHARIAVPHGRTPL